MSRTCDDCGIPRWVECVCTPEGEARADREAEACEASTLVRLTECMGDIASEYRQGAEAGVDAALDRLIKTAVEFRQERAA